MDRLISGAESLSAYQYLVVLGTLTIAYPVLVVLYNLYLHPLSSYPGPRLMSATILTVYYYRLKGQGASILPPIHAKYGPVVRLAPNELSFIDSQAWKDIFGHRSAGKLSFSKDPAHMGPDVAGTAAQGIIRVAKESDHGKQRRIFTNAFSDRALREQEGMIKEYIDLLTTKLSKLSNEKAEIDMVKLFNLTTFDVMGDLAFGESLNMLRDGDYIPWVATVMAAVKLVSVGHALRRFPILNFLFAMLLPKSLREKRREHYEFTQHKVDRRMAIDVSKPDIWSLVMKNESEGQLTRHQMYSNASTFMIAGSETTATLLSGATWLLCHNPEKMATLIKEIRVFTSLEDLTISNLQRCKYLQACLEESLRVYPPFPVATLRLAPKGGANVCGNYVPEGVTVGIPHFATYHSPTNFADPDSFVPERWIEELASERYAKDNKASFQPFSFGPRNCLGKNLAYHEMRLILATIIWSFDISLVDKEDNWIDQPTFELWDKKPLLVRLVPVSR